MVMTQSAETMRTGFQKVEEMVKRPIIFAPEEYCFPQDSETKDTLCAYFDKVAPPADVPTDRKVNANKAKTQPAVRCNACPVQTVATNSSAACHLPAFRRSAAT